MALGNEIALICNGRKFEAIISGTDKPGTVMQIQAGTAAVNGKFTVEAYNRDADGNRPQGPLIVLDNDHHQGKTNDDAYVTGTICQCIIPAIGDELNMRFLDISGTGDDWAIGDLAIVNDGDGKLIATAGTPESEPFMVMEAATDPTADHLMRCIYTGY